MSTEYDEFQAEQNAIEDALDADREPFAGEDPDQDYLAEEAESRMQAHCDKEHGGRDCDCRVVPIASTDVAPF